MKLYLTLEDDDGQKVERVLQGDFKNFKNVELDEIVYDMAQSLEKSKQPL